MKGKDFLTEAIAVNMPDLEAVRTKCLNQAEMGAVQTKEGEKTRRKFRARKLFIPLIAAILLMSMSVTVLGTTVPGINDFIYNHISREMADWMARRNPEMNERLNRFPRHDDSGNPNDLTPPDITVPMPDPNDPNVQADPDGPPAQSAPPAADAPTGLRAIQVTDYSINLSWDAVSGATGYEIYYKTGALAYGSSSETTCILSHLRSATTYSFYIKAITSAGRSGASAIINVTTLAAITRPVPSAPTGLKVSDVGTNYVYFSWNAVAEAQYYETYVNGVYHGYYDADTTSGGIGYLEPGTQYSFYIKAKNSSGTSPASNTVTVTTLSSSVAPPSAPTGLNASNVTANSCTLSWDAVPGNVEYTVYKDGAVCAITGTNTYNVTGLSGGTTYSFHVKAMYITDGGGRSGSSPASNTVAITTVGTLAPPIGLVWTYRGPRGVDLYWTPSSSATSYEVYVDGVLYKTVTSNTCEVTGLSPGTAYSFYVKTKNSNGTSAPSTIITVTTSE